LNRCTRGSDFSAAPEFSEHAHIKREAELEKLRAEASRRIRRLLGAAWRRSCTGSKKWDTVLQWSPPHAEWFGGGKINIHTTASIAILTTRTPQQSSAHLEGEPATKRTLTYQQSILKSVDFANVLRKARGRQGRSRRAVFP